MQCSSRVSALRRELNSHNVASRELCTQREPWRDSGTPTAMRGLIKKKLQHVHRVCSGQELKTNDWEPLCQIDPLHCVGTLGYQSVRRAARRALASSSRASWRRLEYVVHHGLLRGAGSLRSAPSMDTKVSPLTSRRTSRPNPSLKPSPNSKMPGPVCGAVHSPQPGPGIFLPVPA